MRPKKSNGRVYGFEFTAAEKRALDDEIKRQMAEHLRKHELEIEAIVIRQLRRSCGWGETRLKRFYAAFDDGLDKLLERYETPSEDAPWLCTRELKEEGFDVEAWYSELHPNEN